MAGFQISTVRVGGSGRGWRGQAPIVQGFTLLMAAIMLVILIPLVLLGIFSALVAGGLLAAKRWLIVQRRPNGMLDGRKNVRVRMSSGSGDDA